MYYNANPAVVQLYSFCTPCYFSPFLSPFLSIITGVMLCGVPNMIVALGYLTASWTLRVDLVFSYAMRLLKYMHTHHLRTFRAAFPPESMPKRSIFGIFTSTYLDRNKQSFYHCGTEFPFAYNSNYYLDWWIFHYGALTDKHLTLR